MLTDIKNRFSFEKHLDCLLEEAYRTGGVFGLIYIDLDDFKQVNDKFGHHVGDIYMQQASLRMRRQLRPEDMLARLGGDEFAVLVPVVQNRSDVEEIALRLKRCFDQPFVVLGFVLHGSASLGIALYPEDATNKDSLLSAADAAMYASKHSRKAKANPPADSSELLGRHLFGFAFLAHQLQFALGGFDLGRHFLLHARCRFFQLR
jgi:diguanylate cyclase (GGDEF)-like protein